MGDCFCLDPTENVRGNAERGAAPTAGKDLECDPEELANSMVRIARTPAT